MPLPDNEFRKRFYFVFALSHFLCVFFVPVLSQFCLSAFVTFLYRFCYDFYAFFVVVLLWFCCITKRIFSAVFCPTFASILPHCSFLSLGHSSLRFLQSRCVRSFVRLLFASLELPSSFLAASSPLPRLFKQKFPLLFVAILSPLCRISHCSLTVQPLKKLSFV